jgi:hypothetical protein
MINVYNDNRNRVKIQICTLKNTLGLPNFEK